MRSILVEGDHLVSVKSSEEPGKGVSVVKLKGRNSEVYFEVWNNEIFVHCFALRLNLVQNLLFTLVIEHLGATL